MCYYYHNFANFQDNIYSLTQCNYNIKYMMCAIYHYPTYIISIFATQREYAILIMLQCCRI